MIGELAFSLDFMHSLVGSRVARGLAALLFGPLGEAGVGKTGGGYPRVESRSQKREGPSMVVQSKLFMEDYAP